MEVQMDVLGGRAAHADANGFLFSFSFLIRRTPPQMCRTAAVPRPPATLRTGNALLACCALLGIAAGLLLAPTPAAAQFVCVDSTNSGQGATAAGSPNFACGTGSNAQSGAGGPGVTSENVAVGI